MLLSECPGCVPAEDWNIISICEDTCEIEASGWQMYTTSEHLVEIHHDINNTGK
jgi:hypothetical protein